MGYSDYVYTQNKYHAVQRAYNDTMLEKERLITLALPNAIRYDKDHIQSSGGCNILESYVIGMEDEHIDERLQRLKIMMDDWGVLLEHKERELRKSPAVSDRIYVMRYLEGCDVPEIAKSVGYSISQIYRILKIIGERCDAITLM
jgi:hypothetical protein